jgi:2,3-bisphosphoglycerate-dependent phosphoglycerate mutase
VFVRHGESEWNQTNRFTGWHDIGLTATGITQANDAGKVLRDNNYQFDLCFTSVLTRAVHTWDELARTHGSSWVPVVKSWRLNERHYGALTGNFCPTLNLKNQISIKQSS